MARRVWAFVPGADSPNATNVLRLYPGTQSGNVRLGVYDHTAVCAITGGYVYRGCAMPDLQGTYFCGAFVKMWRGRRTASLHKLVPRP